METSIQDILFNICKEYDISEEQIGPIKRKLKKEFYFKLKDIKNLTKEKWKDYMLPDNLYNLLYDKFTVESKKCQWTVCNELSFEICNVHSCFCSLKKPAIYKEERRNVSSVLSVQLTKEEIDQGLNVIDREIKDKDQQREVLGLIEGVIHNLLNHPNEEKYKKININKIRRKYPYDSIMSFFALIKFKKYDDPSFIKYIKEPSWLDNVIPLMYAHYNIPYDKNKASANSLRQCLKKSSLMKKWLGQAGILIDTNPFKSSVTESNNNNDLKSTYYNNNTESETTKEEPEFFKKFRQKKKEEKIDIMGDIADKEKMQLKSIPELIKDEEKRREYIINKTTCLKMPKCYFITNANPKSFNTIKSNAIAHKYVPKEEDIRLFQNQREMMRLKATNYNQQDIESFNRLINTPIVTATDIFFVFPDNYVIQGTFSFVETASDLYSYVRKFIHNPNENFYIEYNNEKIKEDNYMKVRSIADKSPLLMNVIFPIIYCKLKDEELDKYKVTVI